MWHPTCRTLQVIFRFRQPGHVVGRHRPIPGGSTCVCRAAHWSCALKAEALSRKLDVVGLLTNNDSS